MRLVAGFEMETGNCVELLLLTAFSVQASMAFVYPHGGLQRDTPSRCAASLLRQDINGCKPHTVSSHKHGRISQLRTVTRTRLSSALSQPSSAFNASREATANKRWQPPEGYNPGSTSPHSRPWVRKPEVLLSSAPTSSFSYVSPNSTDLWTPEGFSKLAPQHIPTFIMEALRKNDFPEIDSGIQTTWKFFGDTSRYIFDNNFTDFVECAHQTAEEFTTSFYGAAMHGRCYEMEGLMNFVNAEVMKTISSDGRLRRWQWELRKRRRPPGLHTWFVESIGSSDKDGNFEPDD